MNAIMFYIDDWLGSVKILGMTAMEECAFFRLLLISAKSDDCSLPADDRKLAHYARLTPGEWGRSKGRVLECFETLPNGRWRNARLYVEWRRQRKYTAERSRSGLKGAESRWQTNSSAMAEPIAEPSSCEMAEPLAEPSKTGGKSMAEPLAEPLAEPMQVREVREEKNTPASVVLPTSVDSKVFKGENALSPDAAATPLRLRVPGSDSRAADVGKSHPGASSAVSERKTSGNGSPDSSAYSKLPPEDGFRNFIAEYPKQTMIQVAEHAYAEIIGSAPNPVDEHFRLMAGVARLNASTTPERLAVYAPNPRDFIQNKRYLDPWKPEPRKETQSERIVRELEEEEERDENASL